MARFSDVDTFLAIVEASSVRGAAEYLGVTKSTVSRALQRLEAHLGVALVLRDTRSLTLTEAGVAYHRHALRAAASLSEAEHAAAATSSAIEGLLRITSTPSVGFEPLQGMVSDFLALHPNLRIDLVLTNRMVNPVLEEVDLAVRVGQHLRDSDLRTRRLVTAPMVAVATPEVARLVELGGLVPFVHFSAAPGLPEAPIPLDIRLSVDSYLVMVRAVRDGVGMGVASEAYVREDLNAGRLVRVLPDWSLGSSNVWAVYPAAGRVPAKLRALIDHLVAGFDAYSTRA